MDAIIALGGALALAALAWLMLADIGDNADANREWD